MLWGQCFPLFYLEDLSEEDFYKVFENIPVEVVTLGIEFTTLNNKSPHQLARAFSLIPANIKRIIFGLSKESDSNENRPDSLALAAGFAAIPAQTEIILPLSYFSQRISDAKLVLRSMPQTTSSIVFALYEEFSYSTLADLVSLLPVNTNIFFWGDKGYPEIKLELDKLQQLNLLRICMDLLNETDVNLSNNYKPLPLAALRTVCEFLPFTDLHKLEFLGIQDEFIFQLSQEQAAIKMTNTALNLYSRINRNRLFTQAVVDNTDHCEVSEYVFHR